MRGNQSRIAVSVCAGEESPAQRWGNWSIPCRSALTRPFSVFSFPVLVPTNFLISSFELCVIFFWFLWHSVTLCSSFKGRDPPGILFTLWTLPKSSIWCLNILIFLPWILLNPFLLLLLLGVRQSQRNPETIRSWQRSRFPHSKTSLEPCKLWHPLSTSNGSLKLSWSMFSHFPLPWMINNLRGEWGFAFL